MENQDNKNEDNEKKYLEKMRNNQFLKVKNNLLELEKYFMELKDTELKDRKEKMKREVEELLHQPIIVSKDDMDQSKEQEMKKGRRSITKLLDQLINNNVLGKKPKIVRNKSKNKTIRDVSRLCETIKK